MPYASVLGDRAAKMLAPLSVGLLLTAAACTYGPAEESVQIAQIVRLGDTYRAVAVIRHDTFQRPTGLSTFPDGGRWRFLQRSASQFLLDTATGRAVRLASQEAPDSLWESFDAHIAGVEGDSVTYVRFTGCPRDGECYPALSKQAVFRLTVTGDAGPAPQVPPDAVLPGIMLARAPGEQHYVRFSTSGDTITVRLEDDGPYRPAFLVRSDGTVTEIGG